MASSLTKLSEFISYVHNLSSEARNKQFGTANVSTNQLTSRLSNKTRVNLSQYCDCESWCSSSFTEADFNTIKDVFNTKQLWANMQLKCLIEF